MRIQYSIYIAAFSAMVIVGGFFSVKALKTYQPKNDVNVLQGKAAVDIEGYYNENFIAKGIGTHLWALINYLAFNEGRQGVVIGESGWLFTQEEFKQEKNAANNMSENFEAIKNTHHFLKLQNIELVIALIPAKADIYKEYSSTHKRSKVQMEIYPKAVDLFQQNNIQAPDIKTPLLIQKQHVNVFLHSDTHWSVEGAQIVAETIAQKVESINAESGNILNNIHTKKYAFTSSELTVYRGDLLNFVPLGPFFRWFTVAEDTFTSTGVQTANENENENENENLSTDNLFGDEAPELTLVGTSYSAILKWNFAGAIKHYLGEDVLNMAKEGKGPFLPMAEYLASDAFKNTPPRIIIWEIPERFLPVSYDHHLLNNTIHASN